MTAEGAGQGRAVANVLVGMGGVAFVGAAVAVVSKLELRFIDASGMAGFGLLMLATGLFQHWLVREPQGAPHAPNGRR